MHILVVSQYFWPEDFRINDLVEGLASRGHRVTVMTGLPNYPNGRFFSGYGFFGPLKEKFKGQAVLRSPLIPRGRKSRAMLVCNYVSFAIFASIVALFRTPPDIDLIFVYEPSPITVAFPAAVAKWRRRAPIFLWVLDLWPESLAASGLVRSRYAAKVAAAAARFAYRVSDVVLAPSRGYFPSIGKVAARPVDLRHFPQWAGAPGAPTETLEVPVLPAGFRVMFTGNIGDSQDFETILAAAELTAACADIHWIIVGEGRRLRWVQQEVLRRNLKTTVHTLGRFPSSAMPQLMSEADVLLATLRDDPAFAVTIPAKIQSYLAAGKPLVTAISGEVAELIRDAGAGLAVSAGDPAGLAAAVRSMYSMSAEQRADFGSNALSLFNRCFMRDSLIDQLVAWFQEEVARRGRAGECGP